MHIPANIYQFPPVEQADENGLLAIGGDLSPACLLDAYRHGIFPWYNESEPICWWSPDPRCVLFPDKLKISRSMKSLLNGGAFQFTINQSFRDVVISCRDIKRAGGDGTWIQEETVEAYTTLHNLGFAVSGEAWYQGELAGGLYGVLIGAVFFGESMFHRKSNASKFAFIRLVQYLQSAGIRLIDCQLRTDHLVSLGAEMISREHFIRLLHEYCGD